jgi:hypothetical protein
VYVCVYVCVRRGEAGGPLHKRISHGRAKVAFTEEIRRPLGGKKRFHGNGKSGWKYTSTVPDLFFLLVSLKNFLCELACSSDPGPTPSDVRIASDVKATESLANGTNACDINLPQLAVLSQRNGKCKKKTDGMLLGLARGTKSCTGFEVCVLQYANAMQRSF